MDSNPNETPSHSGAVLDSTTSARRPRGIAILSVLAMMGGVNLLVMPIAFAAAWQELSAAFMEMGLPPVLLFVGIAFLAVLTLVSGISMWLGLKWGWWLGCFYSVYAVFRSGSALYTVGRLYALAGAGHGYEYDYMKHSVLFVVSLLLLLYFFKRSVLEYFDLTGNNKRKALGMLVLICVAIVMAFSVCATMVT